MTPTEMRSMPYDGAEGPSGGEGSGEPRQTASLPPLREPDRLAAFEVLLERRREPAPGECGAPGEGGSVPAPGGEEDERLQELGAAHDPDHGVLGAIEIVGQRFHL